MADINDRLKLPASEAAQKAWEDKINAEKRNSADGVSETEYLGNLDANMNDYIEIVMRATPKVLARRRAELGQVTEGSEEIDTPTEEIGFGSYKAKE